MESPLRTLTNEELKQKRQRGWDYVTEVYEPGPPRPIPSKHGYRSQAEPWRPRWQFPRGLGLNIPRFCADEEEYKILTRIIKQRQKAYLKGADVVFLPTEPKELKECPLLKDVGSSEYLKKSPDAGIEICLDCPFEECIYDKREGREIRLRVAENCNQSYNRLQPKVTAKVTFISNHKKGVSVPYQ